MLTISFLTIPHISHASLNTAIPIVKYEASTIYPASKVKPISNGLYEFTVLIDSNLPQKNWQGNVYSSTYITNAYDCIKRQEGSISSLYKDGQMGGGQTVGQSKTERTVMNNTAPGTAGDAVLNYVCKNIISKSRPSLENPQIEASITQPSLPLSEKQNISTSSQAQFDLARKYYSGDGVPENKQEAAKLLTIAANQGNEDAQFMLSILYMVGEGVPQNFREAAKWLTLLANKGNAAAQFHLANLYKQGDGVSKNQYKAVKLYTLSANKGYADAQYMLGVAYRSGFGGLPIDLEQSNKWLKMAAKNGSVHAQKLFSD